LANKIPYQHYFVAVQQQLPSPGTGEGPGVRAEESRTMDGFVLVIPRAKRFTDIL
jgi:hypothetical protein